VTSVQQARLQHGEGNHRTGFSPTKVTISGPFAMTYIGSPTERVIPISETRQIGDPNLAFLATPFPGYQTSSEFDVEGQPLFSTCRDYLDHAGLS
jgi:hypothetical protein